MKTIISLAAALLLGALFSCSSLQVNLPPVTATATGAHLPGKVIWHDLVTEDPQAAQRFYGALFGWQFTSVSGGNYTLIHDGDRAIGGMVDARKFEREGNVSQWVVVLSVTDVDQAASTVTRAGGQIMGGPVDVGERGRLMLVADPQGAMVALLQTRAGDPLDRDAELGEFMWNELWTSDPVGATAFYRKLVPYDSAAIELADGSRYHYLEGAGAPRAAIIANPVSGLAPTWVSFIRVADVRAISTRVATFGGQLMLPSQRNPIGGELAVIKDPSGAGFVIQTWDKNAQEASR